MRTIITVVLCLVILCACNKTFKICEFEATDEALKIYNDVLTELIEHHFYNRYLGEEEEKLAEKYVYGHNNPDTASFRRGIIGLQNKVFNDTSRFSTICLRNELIYGPWTYYLSNDPSKKSDTTKLSLELKTLLTDFSKNWKEVADTLSSPQKLYSSSEFHLCTSKLVPFNNFKECDIGVVSFSKIFLDNSNRKGLLYYEFNCPGNCGMGEILVIERVDNRWSIQRRIELWIS